MTRPIRRSTCPSGLTGAALVAAVVLLGRAVPAAAQACCAGGALVSPVRLAPPDDYAVGVQTRVRSDMGSFLPDGTYVASSTSSEQDVEQDSGGLLPPRAPGAGRDRAPLRRDAPNPAGRR